MANDIYPKWLQELEKTDKSLAIRASRHLKKLVADAQATSVLQQFKGFRNASCYTITRLVEMMELRFIDWEALHMNYSISDILDESQIKEIDEYFYPDKDDENGN